MNAWVSLLWLAGRPGRLKERAFISKHKDLGSGTRFQDYTAWTVIHHPYSSQNHPTAISFLLSAAAEGSSRLCSHFTEEKREVWETKSCCLAWDTEFHSRNTVFPQLELSLLALGVRGGPGQWLCPLADQAEPELTAKSPGRTVERPEFWSQLCPYLMRWPLIQQEYHSSAHTRIQWLQIPKKFFLKENHFILIHSQTITSESMFKRPHKHLPSPKFNTTSKCETMERPRSSMAVQKHESS